MHSTYDSTVNSFYLAFYGRPADPAGLAFWSQQLANNEGDFGAIVDVFANSEEARTRFGSDSVADRITDIYAQLFNRVPDAAGMAFWTNAIEQGHASLADVAMSILGGAQGSDATLSQMRQQAADAFTAQVEASGTEYSGYASIEAARILVRAITPAATAQDLDVLVKAAVSFADTATKTPQVVEAIAVNTTLLALFDTTRGVLEPVGLAQALADTAKAAAGDPVTLESLLRGGGMDKVLKVMPAKATLVDVVDALAKGGLPAAVEVVYPTAPTAPTTPAPNPPSIKLDFLGVTQGEGDTTPDHVTSAVKADVQFAYEGADLRAGQRFEYSTDNGKTWSTAGLGTNTATNIVTIKDVDLGKGAAADSTDSTADLATVFQLRAVDAAGKVFASASQQIVHDHHAAAPVVALAANPAAVHFGEDGLRVTNVKQLVVSGLETGAKAEYRIVSKLKDLDDATVWSDDMPALNDGRHTIAVRQTDAAGNVSQEQWISFTLDTEAPGQPRIALALDTGSSDTDGITHAGAVTIDGLEANTASGWQYSLDNGANWTFGGRNDGSGKATLDLAKLPAHSGKLLVSQIDAAGNTGTPSAALAFTYDDTAPTNAIAFTRIEGGEPGDATTGNPHPGVTFALSGSDDGIVEWRLKDGGAGWTQVQELNDNGSFTVFGLDLGKGDQTVEVRVVDAAGNVGQSIAQTIHGFFAPPAPQFQITATPSGIAITGTATDAVTIDLGKDTIARAGHPEQQNIHDIQKVDASAYAGLVTVVGSAAEVRVATADIGNGVDAYGIVDTKAHLFSGEPGARVFASSDVGLLLEGATFVKLDGMLSLEEHVLLTNLLGQEIDKVELVVDASLPAKPIVALVTDSGTLPFTDHDGITKVAGFQVSNQEHGATLQYSPNGENGWTDMAPPAIEGKNELYVRQVDQAGNVSDVARFTYVLDQTPPPAVSFLHVVGAGIATPTAIDAAQADVVFSVAGTLDEDDIPQYRVGGLGPWTNLPSDAWDGLHNTLTVKGVWLLNEDPKVEVRIVDLAGNEGTAASITVDGPFGNPPPFTLTPVLGGVMITGTATDAVTIDLGKDTIARAGHPEQQYPHDIEKVDVSGYAGLVTVVGSAAEVYVATSYPGNGIGAHGIVDTKAQLFSGEPGARVFASSVVGPLLEGATFVKLDGMLSLEEHVLLTNLLGQEIDKVELVVDASLPAKPIVALVTDSGTLPFTDHDGITKVAGFEVSNQEHGATLQYSPNGENGWTDMAPPAIEGKNELYVRQVDQAGNVSDVARFTYVLDQTPPPAVSFQHVVGASTENPTAIDAVQADVVFSVAGTLDEGDIPQYRVGGLGPWTNLPSDAWDGLHNTLTVKGVWLLNEDPKVEVRIVDLAGNEGTAASMTVNGPFGNIVPVITVTQTPGGLLVESNVAGEIRIGGELVVSDHASGGATVGSVLVGAQQQAFSGKLTVTPAGGQPAPDASGRSYVLGDGESTTLEGRNVWAFDGHDTLKGTPLNDYLSGGAGQDNIKPAGGSDTVVGGAGADRISLERDAYPDTLVYEAGDTLTGVFIDGSELDGMDRINGAEAGDVIQVGAIFSANPTIVDTYLTDPTANQVAIVRGTEVFAFHADKNGNTYVVQWTDGTNINSISLFNTGTNGLALDIDVVNGRMTLAQPVIPVAPEFTLTVQPSGVSIAGTSGDVVMIDLTRDTVERAGHPEVQVPHDILDIAAADYVGVVEVIGNVAEVLALRAGASVNGIDGFNIVDAKSHLFTGEPGARGLAPGVQEALLNGVELVKVDGEVSAEEYALLAGVLGSHIDKVDLSLDDERPALPQVALDIDSGRVPHEYVDNYTNVGTFKVTNLEPGATAQYSLNGIDGWTTTAPAAVAGDNEVYVRQVDTAGNASDVELFGFFLDDVKPLAPTLKLAGDTGRSYNDKVTMLDEVKISGLEQSGTIYQYRTSPGGQWQDGGQADYLGNATLQVPGEGNVFIEVRQVDVAGNEGDPVSLSFVLDKTPPPDVAFAYVTGANMTTPDVTDAVLADVVFSVSGVLDAFDIPQYRIGGSGPWTDLPSAAWNGLDRTITVPGVSLQDEDPLVEVRIVDIAGHEGVPAGRHINGPFGNVEVPPELEPLPMPNYLGAVQPNLHLVPGSLTVSADIGMVTGLANLSGLKVEDFSDGVGKNPEMSFLRPADVAMNGNVLTFSGPVSMDLYRMSWTDGTFSTTDGPMAAATVYFAGGRTSIFQHKGFQVDAITPLAGTIERPYFDAYSEAFIDDGLSTSRVMTGGDHDVIADNGGILTIAYDNIGNGADDIILGFDADDTISLEGSLAQRIDDNADGIIQWHNVPTSSKKTVMPADEAVTITVGNLVTVGVGPMEMAQTLQTLNSRLDVTSFGYGEELLILAKAGFGAMGTLFLFVNQNGGTIDANELTVIASFNEGLPGQDDIVVVGSQTGIPGDFIGGEF